MYTEAVGFGKRYRGWGVGGGGREGGTFEPSIFMTSVQIPPLHGPRIVSFISQ